MGSLILETGSSERLKSVLNSLTAPFPIGNEEVVVVSIECPNTGVRK